MSPRHWRSPASMSTFMGAPDQGTTRSNEVSNGQVVARHVGRPPQSAELVYSYRPFSELPQFIAAAKELHSKTIWTQSGVSAEGLADPKGCWVPHEELLGPATRAVGRLEPRE
jgi:hypothetical protein